MHVCNACVLCNTNTRLTMLIRANKHSKRCMTARSAILVHCANGTLHTAELGCFPLQTRAHSLHDVIGTHHLFQTSVITRMLLLRWSRDLDVTLTSIMVQPSSAMFLSPVKVRIDVTIQWEINPDVGNNNWISVQSRIVLDVML